ncbi:uncharacterized protein LOC105199479 [Solenopsis invicta]|uniref:uncharacterized protein LOC105199479 n=1 Tax=Solenopsis invicta TaxID=13686 RepID=UPI000595BBF1|nr:uncharacterized protein LOC105199479 [Solenopsis invicta]
MPLERAEIDETLARQKRDLELIANFQSRDYALFPHTEELKGCTYFKENLYESGLLAYMSAKSWLTERIAARTMPMLSGGPACRSGSIVSTSTSQLERVKLPKFDGTQRDWQSFKSKFQSLVLNDPSITAVIKFQHLLNYLKEEAGGKLKGLEVTGENFTTAWESLCSRYDNIFLRFSTHFNALLTLPLSAKETSAHLSGLLNTTNESINAFKSLKLPVEHWDMVFIQCIESKLAPATRMDWTKEVETFQDGFFPKFELFKKFLEDRIQTLDRIEAVTQASADSKGKSSNGQQRSSGKQPKGKCTAVHTIVSSSSKSNSSKSSDPGSCAHCQAPHFISKCKGFTALSQGKRKHLAANKGLCTNCLSNRHKVDECKSQGRWLVCAGLHHTRLHQDGQHSGSTTQHLSESSGETTTHVTSSSPQILSESCGTEQLLTTAVVTLQSETGVSLTVRVLLDSCAEQCIVSEYIVQALNLKRKPAHLIVNGTGGTPNTVTQSRFSALVLKKVSNLVPKRQVKRWSHLDGFHLADPHYGAPSRVDCILSSAVFGAAMLPGVQKAVNPFEAPIAHETVFGWVLMGSAEPNNDLSERTSVHHVSVDHELTKAVARFWETEEVPRVHQLAPSNQDCWDEFKKTTFRNKEGCYVVRLPFSETPQFSGIDTTARACMMRLERRFAKQPDVASAYSAFMREYIDLGHMEVVPESEVATNQAYYLPHYPVFRRENCGGSIGRAVEMVLLPVCIHLRCGENVSPDVNTPAGFGLAAHLLKVLTRDAVAFVPPAHGDIWYRLCTVSRQRLSIGLRRSGGASLFTRVQAAPKKSLCGRFFGGGDTPEKAAAAKTELVGILSSSGGQMANHADLFGTAEPLHHRRLTASDAVSTLGLKWLPHTDVFNFKVRLPPSPPAVTKRAILSQIATLFDLVGWVCPVVIRAKLLLQCLWLQSVDWDARVTGRLAQSWLTYRTELTDLEAINIPRWLGTSEIMEWHLHGFCDASEQVLDPARKHVDPTHCAELVRCERHNAITLEQQMAPLPAIRAKPALPFAHSGVDFAGYFWVKASPGRDQKTSKEYVAVFVCLVIKAIHLELVSDLTTDAFLGIPSLYRPAWSLSGHLHRQQYHLQGQQGQTA